MHLKVPLLSSILKLIEVICRYIMESNYIPNEKKAGVFTLGELRNLLNHPDFKASNDNLARELLTLIGDLAEEKDEEVIYNGNPDDPDQPYMLALYQIIFIKFEEEFENDNNIHEPKNQIEKVFKTLHDRLDMNLPYHAPFMLSKNSKFFKEHYVDNDAGLLVYRGDSRDPRKVFGLAEDYAIDKNIPEDELELKSRFSGEDILDSPLISAENNVICCSKKFRTSVFYPLPATKEETQDKSSTWVYVLIPDKLYDMHKHAKSFLPMAIRSNEKIYTYIQSRLRSYEIITNNVPINNFVAAVQVTRLPTDNVLTNPPQFIITDIIANPRFKHKKFNQEALMQTIYQFKTANELAWKKQEKEGSLNETDTKSLTAMKAEEAFKDPDSKKYGRRPRSVIGTLFEPDPGKEIREAVEQANKAVKSDEPNIDDETMQRVYRRFIDDD